MSRPPALAWFFLGMAAGVLFWGYSVERQFDRRAYELNLMQYTNGKMVPKPEYFEILTYLKNGSMK